MMEFTEAQIERYSRQIILPEFGARGQSALLGTTVGIVGTGGPADSAAMYLAAAGIGRLILHPIGENESAERLRGHLRGLNPDAAITVRKPAERSGSAADCSWAAEHDLLLETTGRHDTLLRSNRAAVAHRIPLIAARVAGAHGWLSVFLGHERNEPCAQCAGPPAAGSAAENPNGGPAASADPETRANEAATALEPCAWVLLGALQALACIKLRLGIGADLPGRVRHYSALFSLADESKLAKDPACTVCSESAAA